MSAMLQSLRWQTLEQRRADARLCSFYKIDYGLVAVPLPVYSQQPNRLSRHCHSMTFTQIHTSKDCYKYSFYPLAIVQWNALPQHVVCLPTIDFFKGQLVDCNTPGPRSNVVVFNLILSYKAILTYNALLSFSLTSFICSYFY